jgi:hypothetical protein
MFFCFGCAENMPPYDTQLGKILRLSNERLMQSGLDGWANSRLADKTNMVRELREVGFEWQFGENGCDTYLWSGNDWGEVFPRVVYVSVCERSVDVRATIRDARY